MNKEEQERIQEFKNEVEKYTGEVLPAIQDESELKEITSEVLKLRELEKGIKNYFAPLKTQAHNLHKDICAKEKEALQPVQEQFKKRDLLIRN